VSRSKRVAVIAGCAVAASAAGAGAIVVVRRPAGRPTDRATIAATGSRDAATGRTGAGRATRAGG